MIRKTYILIIVSMLVFGFVPRKHQNPGILDGTWLPVRQELAGRQLPNSAFEGYKLTVHDSIYTYGNLSIDQGVLSYADGKMDIFGRKGVNAGKHFTAIYKLEDTLLTICYNLKGDSYPSEFETKASPALFLSGYKRLAGN